MDIVAAARQHLLTSDRLVSLLGSGKGFDCWLFVGADDMAKPFVNMEGTQSACVLIREQGGWASPNQHNTMAFPQLVVEVYIDPVRDFQGNVLTPDLKPRFQPIHEEISRLLHRPQGKDEVWGDVRTLGSQQMDLWTYFRFTDTDGVGVSRATFGVVVG